MIKKLIFGLAVAVTCFSIGTSALADPWKNESGKGKGHYKHKWKEHGGGTPDWARGNAYWGGGFRHGRSPEGYWHDRNHYDGGHYYRSDYGYRSYGSYSYQHESSPSYAIPNEYPQYPYSYYGPIPNGQGWNFEGSIRIYTQPGW